MKKQNQGELFRQRQEINRLCDLYESYYTIKETILTFGYEERDHYGNGPWLWRKNLDKESTQITVRLDRRDGEKKISIPSDLFKEMLEKALERRIVELKAEELEI